MAKKIKFPLIMENNVAVRNIDSLREHFSLPIIIEYKKTGKLITWLRDHYEAGLAEALEAIDNTDVEIAGKICEIFGVEFTEEMRLNLEKETARKKRIALLKAYTDNEDFINVIDNIAFNQDELFSLLDNGLSEIYLCGEIFSIPLSQIGITYVGIGKPIVTIDSEVEVDWQEKKIVLKDIVFDEKYQKIIELAEKTNKELSEQQSHTTSASGAFGYGIKLISSTKPASKMTSNMLNSTSGAFGYGIKLISSTKPACKMTSNMLNSTSGSSGYGIKTIKKKCAKRGAYAWF